MGLLLLPVKLWVYASLAPVAIFFDILDELLDPCGPDE